MNTDAIPICGEHEVLKEWRTTVFQYDEDGVSNQGAEYQSLGLPDGW